jgi:phosphopantothenoylcysteine decarboxylase/phosphopantothenate--cysteine ligase
LCGSIAAYKAAEAVSQLAQRGALVTPMMTPGARRFITPLTLQTLSGQKALYKNFDPSRIDDPTHIKLAHATELVLIAPATANVLGKMAHGIADDLLTTFVLAVRCPILIAPAMNTQMWTHPAVQDNVRTLKSRGVRFVEPGDGHLACGDVGPGRLAEPMDIVKAVEGVFKEK